MFFGQKKKRMGRYRYRTSGAKSKERKERKKVIKDSIKSGQERDKKSCHPRFDKSSEGAPKKKQATTTLKEALAQV